MDALLNLWEKPVAYEKYMVVGWEQWADAGEISSGLPRYLIDRTGARRIGEIKPDGFYLFQIPGTHHFIRPQVKLEGGYRKTLTVPKNELFYTSEAGKGLVIFLGDEPHVNAERYADVLLDAVQALGVRRVVALGGVYGAMPYDKDRQVSCVYSLRRLKDELARYAVTFSDYEGGVTISTYLAGRAEQRGIELVVFYSFVPAYDFSPLSSTFQGVRIERDFRAWYELVRRLNHMFGLSIGLADLRQQSNELTAEMDARIAQLDRERPQLEVRKQLQKLSRDFTETPFMPLDEMWERELRDLFEKDT
jgi:predicted ATP-grasp superfamily ATP-dependent carboligase